MQDSGDKAHLHWLRLTQTAGLRLQGSGAAKPRRCNQQQGGLAGSGSPILQTSTSVSSLAGTSVHAAAALHAPMSAINCISSG